MNQRACLQPQVQETVEGLSIAAITYYVVGLVGYVARWVPDQRAALSVEFTQMIAVPMTALLIWRALKRVKAGLGSDEPR